MSDTEGKAISDKESTKGDEKDRVRNIVKSLSLSLSLRYFLSRAPVAILFSGAESFGQFQKRAL